MLNQTFRKTISKACLSTLTVVLLFAATLVSAQAQDVQQIRWKTEAQVREILGEPQSTTPPVGTHATYTLWNYDGYTVAFADGSAFHLFRTNSLNKMELEENRPSDEGA